MSRGEVKTGQTGCIQQVNNIERCYVAPNEASETGGVETGQARSNNRSGVQEGETVECEEGAVELGAVWVLQLVQVAVSGVLGAGEETGWASETRGNGVRGSEPAR